VGFFEGQSTKPDYDDARLAGSRPIAAEADFSFRWVRIFLMTTESSMQSITLTVPPHSRHVSMSISSGPAVDPSGLLPLAPTPDSLARHPAPTALGAPESGPRVEQWFMG
jgi:hypothetical protein